MRQARWAGVRAAASVAVGIVAATGMAGGQSADYARANYTKFEYRIPMRDGVKLFTAVYVPKDGGQNVPHPAHAHAVQRGAVRHRRLQSQPGPIGPVHA